VLRGLQDLVGIRRVLRARLSVRTHSLEDTRGVGQIILILTLLLHFQVFLLKQRLIVIVALPINFSPILIRSSQVSRQVFPLLAYGLHDLNVDHARILLLRELSLVFHIVGVSANGLLQFPAHLPFNCFQIIRDLLLVLLYLFVVLSLVFPAE